MAAMTTIERTDPPLRGRRAHDARRLARLPPGHARVEVRRPHRRRSCGSVRCRRRTCRCSASSATWPTSSTTGSASGSAGEGPNPPLRGRRPTSTTSTTPTSPRRSTTGASECAHAREVVARFESLDDVGAGQKKGAGISLRWTLVHMIEEYARHNGHADLLREAIDGTTGD